MRASAYHSADATQRLASFCGTANGNTRQIITLFDYIFWPGTCAVQQMTTTWPALRERVKRRKERGERKSWTACTANGHKIWNKDERSSSALSPALHSHRAATVRERYFGEQLQPGPLPNGRGSSFNGPSGGGLVNFATYNYFLINAVSITITRKDGKITDAIQAVRFTNAAGSSSSSSCSGSGHTSSSSSGSGDTSTAPVTTAGALSPSDSFPQCAYTRWTTTQYSDCCFVASQRAPVDPACRAVISCASCGNELGYARLDALRAREIGLCACRPLHGWVTTRRVGPDVLNDW